VDECKPLLLGVDSPDSLRMAQALATMLPGADMYYAQQRPDQQHLTLGRFGGTDAAAGAYTSSFLSST
jgi:hypothetical protein